jgi:hypothetical protein
MRFSDMMGSGAEPAPKRSTSEPEDAIAEALAPYLDTPPRPTEPATNPAASPAANPDATALVPVVPLDVPLAAPTDAPTVAAVAPIPPVAPVPPVAPAPPVAPSAPVAIDYTPLSDDLLPHRQARGRS